MRKAVMMLLLLLCLCAFASGCGNAEGGETTQPPTEAAVTEAPAVTEAVVETTQATEPTVAQTVPATEPPRETIAWEDTAFGDLPPEQKLALVQPAMDPPEVPEGPCHFYDDAAFVGDSISYSLMVHNTKHGDLGSPLFLVRGSLGLHNTLHHQMEVFYQGQSMTPWDALAAAGVNKVFLLLGMNDIGYYGIDATMVQWESFVANVREASPDIEIYIQSLTPVWFRVQQELLNNDNVDLYNARLEEFCEANDCHFVNIAPYFKDHTNGLAEPYCADQYVHMSEAGNVVWTKVLLAYAAEQEKENP